MKLELDKSHWIRVTLGDVASSSKEKVDPASGDVERYIAGEHMDSDQLRLARWGDVSEVDLGPAFHRRFRPGQVLYGSRRTYLRKVAVADFEGVCANTTFVIESKDKRVLLQEFLPFVLTSERFHAFAIAESKGSVNPYVNWSDIARYEFSLPPITEQQRIADLLWTLEQHQQACTKLSCQLSTFASQWIWLVRQEHSEVKFVRDVATVKNGQNYPRSMQDGRSGDVPFFKVADLDAPGNERYLTNPSGWISQEDVLSLNADVLPEGAVVTARVGAAIRLERRRAVRVPSLVDENHLVIRPVDVDPEYLLAVLTETKLASASNDGVVPSLNQKIVGDVPLPLLDPEHERYVGNAYSAIGDARETSRLESRRLMHLRKSLLAEIFEGS